MKQDTCAWQFFPTWKLHKTYDKSHLMLRDSISNKRKELGYEAWFGRERRGTSSGLFFSVLLSTYTPLCDRTDILFSRSEFLRRKDCELADSDLDGGCGWWWEEGERNKKSKSWFGVRSDDHDEVAREKIRCKKWLMPRSQEDRQTRVNLQYVCGYIYMRCIDIEDF